MDAAPFDRTVCKPGSSSLAQTLKKIRDRRRAGRFLVFDVTWFMLFASGPGYQAAVSTPNLEVAMTALAQALSRVSGSDVDVDSLRVILIFCAIGLLASALLLRTEGLDMSIAFM